MTSLLVLLAILACVVADYVNVTTNFTTTFSSAFPPVTFMGKYFAIIDYDSMAVIKLIDISTGTLVAQTTATEVTNEYLFSSKPCGKTPADRDAISFLYFGYSWGTSVYLNKI